MFVQIVTLTVKADRIDDFLRAFRINFEGTIREAGCLRFDLLQDEADPTRFTVYEVFRSEKDLEAHRRTEHYRKTVAFLEEVLHGPRGKTVHAMIMSDLPGSGSGAARPDGATGP
jgi:autoinducer 2-degrading protein